MASPNRWALREAGEATFYDVVTGEAKVTLNTLKMSNVETNAETVYAQGGRGNPKLVPFSGNREARITLQDAIFDNAALAMLTGNEVLEGTQTVDKREVLASATNALTLSKTPTEVFSVFQLGEDGVTKVAEATYTEAAGVITITEPAMVDDGTKFLVYYQCETVEGAKTITVSSDKFGGIFRVVVDVLVRDEFTGQDFYAQFRAPRAKIEDEFSFEFSPDGDPSVLDLPLEILKDPASTNMWELVIYSDEV